MLKKTLIILFLGLLSTNCTKKLDETLDFPYEEEFDDICDKEIPLEIDEYVNHYTFREFNQNLQESNTLQIDNMIFEYTTHLENLKAYVAKLEEIKAADIVDSNLSNSSETFVITKIFKIASEISLVIGGAQQTPAFPKSHEVYGQKNLNFFLKKFEYLFNSDNNKFMYQSRAFVENQIDSDTENVGNYYFDQELCNLLDLIIPVVKFYLQKDSEDKYVIDGLDEKKSDLVKQFFREYFQMKRTNLTCSHEGGFLQEFLNLFFSPEEVTLLLEDKKLNNITGPKFNTNMVQKDNSSSFNIYKMDKNFIDIKKNIFSLDLPTIRQYTEHPSHFSYPFMLFLDNLYVRVYDSVDPEDDSTNAKENKAQTALRLTRLIYKLYIYARNIDLIDKDFPKETEPILKVLLELIMGPTFKKTENPDDEFEPNLEEVNTTKQEIRNNFLPLLPLLNGEDPEEDVLDQELEQKSPLKRSPSYIDKNGPAIFDILKNFGQISDINILMNNHNIPSRMQDDIRKNNVSIVLADIGEAFQKKFKNKKDDDKTESSNEIDESEEDSEDDALPASKEDEEIENLIKVVVVNKRPKKTMATRGIPNRPIEREDTENVGIIEKTLVDQLVDKIETNTNDPVKEKKWRKFILKFITKLNQKIEVDQDIWFNINNKLLNIMKQSIHSVDGFFKLFEWALSRKESFFPSFKENFDYGDDQELQEYQQQINNEKYVFNVDNVLFVILAKEKQHNKQMEMIDQNEQTHTTAWFTKFHNLSYSEFLNQHILRGPFFFDRFHSFEFFFEVVDIFKLFDNITVKSSEEQDRYGEIFLNLYRFILDVREDISEEGKDAPLDYIVYLLKDCLNYTFLRETPSKFDRSMKFCTQSYRNYAEIIWFIKYYGYSINDEELTDQYAIEEFWSLKEEDVKTRFFLVETSPFIIYINKITTNHLNILCEHNASEQICLESNMYVNAIDNLSNSSYNFESFDRVVFEPFKAQMGEKKYVLWNVLETVHRYDKNTFQKFLVSFDRDNKNNEKTLDFIRFLQIEENDHNWLINYMKYNFALYTLKYRALERAVRWVFDNNQLQKYLFDVHLFNYHGATDEHQVFHFRNIGIFLYFAHSAANYEKLSRYISQQGWLILLFKNGDYEEHDKLLNLSQEIHWVDLSEEKADEDNAEILFKFLHSQRPVDAQNAVGVKLLKEEEPLTDKLQAKKEERNSRFANRKNKKKNLKIKKKDTTKVKESSEEDDAMIDESLLKKKIEDRIRITVNRNSNTETLKQNEAEQIKIGLLNGGNEDSELVWSQEFMFEDTEGNFLGQNLIDNVEVEETEVGRMAEFKKLVDMAKQNGVEVPQHLQDGKSLDGKDIEWLSTNFALSNVQSTQNNQEFAQYLKKYVNSKDNFSIKVISQEVELTDQEKMDLKKKII